MGIECETREDNGGLSVLSCPTTNSMHSPNPKIRLSRTVPGHVVSGLRAVMLCIMVLSTRAFGAVDLSLPDIHGEVHRLSDYRGQWVILNFWATWCPPCLEEIPDLILFHEAHKGKDAVVIGVNFEELGKSDLERFIDEQFVSYPILRMDPTVDTPLGRVYGLPTTYIISPEGEVVKVHMGPISMADLENYIRIPYARTNASIK